jgi:hypothetical protein
MECPPFTFERNALGSNGGRSRDGHATNHAHEPPGTDSATNSRTGATGTLRNLQRRSEHFFAAIICGAKRLARNLSAACVAAQVVNDPFDGGSWKTGSAWGKHHYAGHHEPPCLASARRGMDGSARGSRKSALKPPSIATRLDGRRSSSRQSAQICQAAIGNKTSTESLS